MKRIVLLNGLITKEKKVNQNEDKNSLNLIKEDGEKRIKDNKTAYG